MSKFFDTWTVKAGSTTDLVKTDGTLTISQSDPKAPIVFSASKMGKSDGDTRNNNDIWGNVTNAQIITKEGTEYLEGTVEGRKGDNPFTMNIESSGDIHCVVSKAPPGPSVGANGTVGDDDDGEWNGGPQ